MFERQLKIIAPDGATIKLLFFSLHPTRVISTYNADGYSTEDINFKWVAAISDWVNTRKYTSTATNISDEDATYVWDTLTVDWRLESKCLLQYLFDDYGYTTQRIRSDFDFNDSTWVRSDRIDYYRSLHGASGIKGTTPLPCLVYPNPSRDVIFIDGLEEPAEASLYSLQGSLIQTVLLHGATSRMNIQNLPAGTYMLSLKAGDKTAVQRVVKE